MKRRWFMDEVGEDYAIISTPDNKMLTRLIYIAKGSLSVEKFAYKCGISSNVFYSTIRDDRKWPIRYDCLEKIMRNSDPDCGITKEMWLSANGMSDKLTAQTMFDDVADKRKQINAWIPQKVKNSSKEWAAEKNFGKPVQYTEPKICSEYDQFINDLAYYSVTFPDSVKKMIHANKDELFADKGFVEALSRYHQMSEEERENNLVKIRSFFLSGKWENREATGAQAFKYFLDECIGGHENE